MQKSAHAEVMPAALTGLHRLALTAPSLGPVKVYALFLQLSQNSQCMPDRLHRYIHNTNNLPHGDIHAAVSKCDMYKDPDHGEGQAYLLSKWDRR
jgi:hypothetical protein